MSRVTATSIDTGISWAGRSPDFLNITISVHVPSVSESRPCQDQVTVEVGREGKAAIVAEAGVRPVVLHVERDTEGRWSSSDVI